MRGEGEEAWGSGALISSNGGAPNGGGGARGSSVEASGSCGIERRGLVGSIGWRRRLARAENEGGGRVGWVEWMDLGGSRGRW